MLQELNIDVAKEKEEIKYIDAKVLQEMKDLKLYDLFYGENKTDNNFNKNDSKGGES